MTNTTAQWFRSELEALLSIRNDAIRELIRQNPVESIYDRDEPDFADIKIHRVRLKDAKSEIYAEMSENLAIFFKTTDQTA